MKVQAAALESHCNKNVNMQDATEKGIIEEMEMQRRSRNSTFRKEGTQRKVTQLDELAEAEEADDGNIEGISNITIGRRENLGSELGNMGAFHTFSGCLT